ncbi:MAG: SIR2 family NAD-dependent protein deacylase [Flavobacteriales bacterium]
MKKLIVFSGAGVSAESGLKTFRDSGGLWEEYNIMDVATPEAWNKNPRLVLEFYNKRRYQIINTQPNDAHYVIAELEKDFDVQVITQNIDDLHERAGSKNVLHLHGEITKSRSTNGSAEKYIITSNEIKFGDLCPNGYQLRPDVVWFGEEVPNIHVAEKIISQSDFLIVVGTSLNVYPAAGLVFAAPTNNPKYIVDPNSLPAFGLENIFHIKEKATIGMPIIAQKLKNLLLNA